MDICYFLVDVLTQSRFLGQVMPNVLFAQGSTVGVHYSPTTNAVTWYVKQPFGPEAGTRNIGSCKLIPNLAETIYPCFAIYSKRTVIQVEFPPQVPADIANDTKRDVFTPDTGAFTARTPAGCSMLVQNVCTFVLNLQRANIPKYSQNTKIHFRLKNAKISAVSTPILTAKAAFCSIFQALSEKSVENA